MDVSLKATFDDEDDDDATADDDGKDDAFSTKENVVYIVVYNTAIAGNPVFPRLH